MYDHDWPDAIWSLALFTVAASMVFHAYWSVPAAQQFVTQLLFMKNMSVAGGMLLISALGAGPLSIDALRSTRTSTGSEGAAPKSGLPA